MDPRSAEILNRFHQSWIDTLKSYDKLLASYSGWEKVRPLRDFILKLKGDNEVKFFRLGTSIHHLIISRSVDFCLRPDQKFIRIEPITMNDFEITFRDGEKIYRQYRVASLEDGNLKQVLDTLKSTLID